VIDLIEHVIIDGHHGIVSRFIDRGMRGI